MSGAPPEGQSRDGWEIVMFWLGKSSFWVDLAQRYVCGGVSHFPKQGSKQNKTKVRKPQLNLVKWNIYLNPREKILFPFHVFHLWWFF